MMNKPKITTKTKMLAEQAGFHFYDMTNIDGQNLGYSVESDSWESLEKFKSLVLKTSPQVNELEGIVKAIDNAGFSLLRTGDNEYQITKKVIGKAVLPSNISHDASGYAYIKGDCTSTNCDFNPCNGSCKKRAPMYDKIYPVDT